MLAQLDTFDTVKSVKLGEQKISLSEGRLAGAAERLFSGPTGPQRHYFLDTHR